MKLELNLVLLSALLCVSVAYSIPDVTQFSAVKADLQSCDTPSDVSYPSVVGGRPLTQPVSSMASLRKRSGPHYCGGTLIHPQVVLTAAHCIVNGKDTPIDVDVGRLRRMGEDHSNFLSYKTVKILIHENYNSTSYEYDIAILILNKPCPFTPLPLASSDACFEIQGGCRVRILGWGVTETTHFSSVLREACTTSVSRRMCELVLGASTVSNTMICAGELRDGKIDICGGDSGGPLIQGGKQVGITSFSYLGVDKSCGQKYSPGVYVSVPKLKPWIVSQLSKFSLTLPEPPPSSTDPESDLLL